MKQTAVEWLMSNVLGLTLQLSNNRISQRTCELKILELFEQAKEMEKEQIIDAVNSQRQLGWDEKGEQYYNKTFKSE